MGIKKEEVAKALGELEDALDVEKASDGDLDQPEGSDLNAGHAGNKMSDAAGESKKAKKSASDDEEEDDMEKETTKSFAEDLSEEVQTQIDVSDFLRSLVDSTGEAIDSLGERLAKSEGARNEQYEGLTEAVDGIQESQAKIGIVLKAICERIGVIEAAPAYEPKAETDVVKSTEPAERSFENGLDEGGEEPMFKSLSKNPLIAKSQMSTAICDLVKKGDAKDMDVINFETSGHIRPEVLTGLKTILNN
jgi:hypothetical protein